nr:NUDIX hydrolase [Propionibacterium sp.]
MELDLPVLAAGEIADEIVHWPIVEHGSLGRGVIQEFVRDRVRTPSGEVMTRDYLAHTGAVGVIALDDEERVLAVRQYRHPVGFRLLEPPAGLLDLDGEHWLAAAERELAEEAGVAASDWRVLVDYMTSPGCLQESLRVYLARGLTPCDRPEGFVADGEEAHMDVVLVPLDDLVDAIYAGRVQNPTMVVGALSAYAALRTGRVDGLRTPSASWPARDAKHDRDAELARLRAHG